MTERHFIIPSVVRHDMRNGVLRHDVLNAVVRHEIGTPGEIIEAPAYSPDFAGHTRYEWPAEALDLTNLDLVESWTDVSQGLTVEQSVTASRPQYFASDGGYPSVQFDGADDFLEGVASSIDSSNGLTVFVVGRFLSYIKNSGPLTLDAGALGSADDRLELYASLDDGGAGHNYVAISNRQTDFAFLASGTSDFTTGTDHMLTALMWDGSDGMYAGRTQVDAAPTGTGSLAPANDFTRIIFGQGFNSIEGHFAMRALVIYEGQLDTAEIASVWASLESRYGGPF